MAYIEREAAIEVIMSQPPDAHYPQWYADKIKGISAADVAHVRHGRWLPFHSTAAGDIQYCSACEIGCTWKPNYCPNCGAKMDGGNDG